MASTQTVSRPMPTPRLRASLSSAVRHLQQPLPVGVTSIRSCLCVVKHAVHLLQCPRHRRPARLIGRWPLTGTYAGFFWSSSLLSVRLVIQQRVSSEVCMHASAPQSSSIMLLVHSDLSVFLTHAVCPAHAAAEAKSFACRHWAPAACGSEPWLARMLAERLQW